MYRTTAATGGSHPQHILLLETHIFPAKCQLGEEIKVSQGLAAAPVGSEFHTNERIRSSISHPLGMSHRGLHPPSPARAAPRPLSTGFSSTTSCALSSSARVPGCTWGATGCPQGCPLTRMGCTVYTSCFPELQPTCRYWRCLHPAGQAGTGFSERPASDIMDPAEASRPSQQLPPFPTGVFPKPLRVQAPHQKLPGHTTFPLASTKT